MRTADYNAHTLPSFAYHKLILAQKKQASMKHTYYLHTKGKNKVQRQAEGCSLLRPVYVLLPNQTFIFL